jgi:predicted metal-dependent phosphoesterase TrpH
VKIDLHCHTTASDGICAPSDLVKRARTEKLSCIAIADHDTIDGIEPALAEASRCDVSVIPSIEFSVEHKGGDFHLLGYYIDHRNSTILGETERFRKIRERRIPRMVEGLRNAGIDITEDDVLEESSGSSPGKPHVARALMKKGIVANFDEAFERYLSSGKPGDIPKEKISLENAFSCIKEAGGIAVCAHPASLGFTPAETLSFLRKLIPLGLSGLECYSNMHTDNDVREYIAIARALSLVITGGSDFHGDKGEALGEYGKGRTIPSSCLEELAGLHR